MPEGPAFSIVIPVFREQRNIARCLDSLEQVARIEQAEIIVVDGDGGSTLEAIPRRHWRFALRTILSPPGRGGQMNAGAAEAVGEILVFLHVDTFLPRRALDLVEGALGPASAGAFSVDHPSGRLFKWWVGVLNLFKGLFRTPYGDQVFFMRRDTFWTVGGFEEIPIMEDVSFMRRLHRRHMRIRILRAKVVTSDRRWRKTGYAFNFLRNVLLLWLYFLGLPPRWLAVLYRPNSTSLETAGDNEGQTAPYGGTGDVGPWPNRTPFSE
jgi:rSAM/selenodomain-associated transferase 2